MLDGTGGKVNPPIRTRDDVEALWAAVLRGDIDWVASDHACCMESQKGDDVWPALPGFGGTALLYPVTDLGGRTTGAGCRWAGSPSS